MKIKWKKWIILAFFAVFLLNLGNLGRLFYPVKYMEYIRQSADLYKVDPYLIMSIIKSESNFRHDAVSSKQATGLMQITKPTALWLAERMELTDFEYEDITEPALNIQMGCYYVAYLLELYNANEKNAIAAYNAGEGTVDRWLLDKECSRDGVNLSYVPYPETRRYITQVINHEKMYRLLYKVRSSTFITGEYTNEVY